MPRIDIKEIDLTQGTSTIGTDIPYIPGFCVKQETTPSYPVLCSSVTQFEYYFGSAPIQFDETYTMYKIESGDLDRSYIMAKELLSRGMPVYYHALVTSEEIKEDTRHPLTLFELALNEYLSKALAENAMDDGTGLLTDRDEYTVKYLTTGGYHNFGTGFDGQLLSIAAKRGDCVALIEDAPMTTVNPENTTNFWNKVCMPTSVDTSADEYGAAFSPWAFYNVTGSYKVITKVGEKSKEAKVKEVLMPACYGYLVNLASNIKTSPNWLAMAGTTRGLVPTINYLATGNERLSNMIANRYQPTKAIEGTMNGARAVNAITDIKPYGLTIWGNRTLKLIGEDGLTATNFLNTRNMISDIKKVAYRAAKAQLFEQNSEILWTNFKAEVSPFLEQLKKGNGISDYKLLKLNTTYKGDSLGKEEFACAIKIYPLYAVEAFEITVVVSDNEISVG